MKLFPDKPFKTIVRMIIIAIILAVIALWLLSYLVSNYVGSWGWPGSSLCWTKLREVIEALAIRCPEAGLNLGSTHNR